MVWLLKLGHQSVQTYCSSRLYSFVLTLLGTEALITSRLLISGHRPDLTMIAYNYVNLIFKGHTQRIV